MLRLSLFLLMVLIVPAGAAERAPGDMFKDCETCPEMVVVPSGTFTMGKDDGHKYEMPAHSVTIAKPFAIGRYELLFSEWKACFDAGGCTRDPDDHKWGRDGRPVINIHFADTLQFTKWLSKKTGATYRLPSEAEWEYAARAGTTTPFFWGELPGINRANCRDCETKWSKKSSAPVGSFEPNPWGLYDMHGNIWEWTMDCWTTSHIGAPTDGSARADGDCGKRVMRSGSWYYFHRNARSSWRFKNDARVNSYNIGVRVVRELP